MKMPRRNQDLVGKRFGHLTVLRKSKQRGQNGAYYWVCQCDCGRLARATTALLNSGEVKSCGHTHEQQYQKYLKPSKKRHLAQLNDKLPRNNHTGYKNISKAIRHGKTRYRVAVVYDQKQHSKLANSLEEALKIREELREKWWPTYNK